jgi:Putative transmembrane protein (PGPGW)
MCRSPTAIRMSAGGTRSGISQGRSALGAVGPSAAPCGCRVGRQVLGWALVVLSVAALILPGPGLLLLAAGLVVLSQEYEWAAPRVEPVRTKGLEVAKRQRTDMVDHHDQRADGAYGDRNRRGLGAPTTATQLVAARAVAAARRLGHWVQSDRLRADRDRAADLLLPPVLQRRRA